MSGVRGPMGVVGLCIVEAGGCVVVDGARHPGQGPGEGSQRSGGVHVCIGEQDAGRACICRGVVWGGKKDEVASGLR